MFLLDILKMSFFLIFLVLPTMVLSDCGCEAEDPAKHDKRQTLKYKIGAIFSILIAGAVGILLPLLSKKIPALSPEKDLFFMIKAFAAGVILSTGFIHILPDAFGDLTSGCLDPNPWQNFPFTGFIAMMSAIMTLLIDSYATSYYKRMHNGKDENVHLHGHAHGSALTSEEHGMSDIVRQRVVSQVLELGIVVHSVIIGISLGASQSLDTIKPLIGALSFHQFFEGMGLGGCISQAKFESLSTLIMAAFFSLTTPVGIAIGIGISSVYSETSQTSLIVEGCFNAAAAGILIYMALVDLLAADFMNPKVQNNVRLQLGLTISLLLGAGCMSVLAKWA